MSTPADYLFNQFNDPLAGATTAPPADPLGQQGTPALDPVSMMSSHVAASYGGGAVDQDFSAAGNDFATMQRFRMQRRGLKDDDLVGQGQLQATYGQDTRTMNLAAAADQLETGAVQQLYAHFIGQGLEHKEALLRAEYSGRAQTDQLLNDPNFSSAFASQYGINNPTRRPSAEELLQQEAAAGPGRGALGAVADAGAIASAVLAKGVLEPTAALVGAKPGTVSEGIREGAGEIEKRLNQVADKSFAENVGGFFRNLYHGVSAEVQYGIPQAYYGGAFLIADYFGDDSDGDGIAAGSQEWLDKYNQSAADKQSFFTENDIAPDSLGVGIGQAATMFAGGGGFGALTKSALTRGIGIQVGRRAQSLISASPMSAYVGGTNYAQVRKEGSTKNQALGYASLTGAAAVVAESLPFGSMLKRFNVSPGTKGVLAKLAAGEKVGAAQAKSAISAFLRQGTTELTEETFEELIDIFGQVGILDRDATNVIRDSVAPYMGQTVPVSFLFGAFLGAGTSPLAVRRARQMGKLKADADRVVAAGDMPDADAAKIMGDAALGSTAPGEEERVDLTAGAEAPAQASQVDADVATRSELEAELTQAQIDLEQLELDGEITDAEKAAQQEVIQTNMAEIETGLSAVEAKITGASLQPEGGRETAGEVGAQVQTQPGEGVEEGAGDVGIYAQEVSRMKVLAQELELDDAALELQLQDRADILDSLNPAEREQFKMAGALQAMLSPEFNKYAETIAETNPEQAAELTELAGQIESSGDVAIASLLATGNREVPELIKTISRAPGTEESAVALERMAEIMNGTMGFGDPDILASDQAIAQASVAFTQLGDKVTAIRNGELTGPTASVVSTAARVGDATRGVVQQAGEAAVGRAQYNATRVSANRLMKRIVESIPGNTPITQEIVDQMQTMLDSFPARFPGDTSAINMLKENLGFLTTAQKQGKTTVDSFFDGVRSRLGSGATTAVSSTEQRLAFSQAQADRMAASLNISGVSSFVDLQGIANDPKARAKDRATARRVVDAVISRDISTVATEQFEAGENVASVDINQVINDLISSGRVNSFEQSIGQLERGTTTGKNSDDLFTQLVRKESEKQAARRLRSEAVGADAERVSTFDEIRGRVYQKTGVLNDAVTTNYTRTLIQTFLSSRPMAVHGIATESELNRALLGSDGNVIRKKLNTFLEARLTGEKVSSRSVRDALRDVAEGMGTEQEDAVSLEITEIDKILKDFSDTIGQPVTVDFITSMLLKYAANENANVETLTTRFLRAFKNFGRKKTVGDIRNDSDPRMYYGWALSRLPGTAPRRSLAAMASDVISNGAEYLSKSNEAASNSVIYSLTRKRKTFLQTSPDALVGYMQDQFDQHRAKHPADTTIDTAFLAKIFSDIIYGPETGIVGEDGTVFNAQEHAEQLNKKVRKLGRTQAAKEDEIAYWQTVPLGFITEEELFGKDLSVSASHQQAIKHLLALNGSPVAADVPVLYLTPDVNRADAASQIQLLIKSGMLRDRADILRKTRHDFPLKEQVKMLGQADKLLEMASRTEKEALRRLEKYAGSPASRKAHVLFEDMARNKLGVPIEALLKETYQSTSQPEPGVVDYRGGSATMTLRVIAQRLGVLPTSHAAYSNLRRHPDLVRGIFDKMFTELVADPSSLLNLDPEFLGVVESVYGIQIRTNGDEVFIDKVSPVESISDAIDTMAGRITYLTDNINLLRGLRNDRKAKQSIQNALKSTFAKSPLITPAITQFLKEGKTHPGVRQGTIDSILRYAMGLAAKEQDARLTEMLDDEIQRSRIQQNLQLLMTGQGTEDEKVASRSYLTGVLSNGGSVGGLVQTANTIKAIPEMRQLSARIVADLRQSFGRAKQDNIPDHERNAAANESESAWAEISGMALGINGLVPDDTATLDAQAISTIFNIPLSQASAALRGDTEKTISYLLSITRDGKTQDIFAADLARGDEGAQGVMNILAIGRIQTQTGVNLTPGTIDMMGDVIENLNDFKGAANLLALFQTGHGRQLAQHDAISTVVRENMRGLQAAIEAAEANMYTLSDQDSEAALALRSTADLGPMLTLDLNNLRSFVNNPEPIFASIPEDQAKQSALYMGDRVAQGQELLHSLDTIIGTLRTNPELMDRDSAVRAFAAASEFFKSGERTQLYNWVNWAYTAEGRQALINNPSAMPDTGTLNKLPDSLGQAAELLGSKFGVNSVAVRGLGSLYASAFGPHKKIDVDGKMMTVDEIQKRLSDLWQDARQIEGPQNLGIPVVVGEPARQSRAGRAAAERARLYQALQDNFDLNREDFSGDVAALLDLAHDTDAGSVEFNEQIAEMASMLAATGRVEAAISLLNRMPLDAANTTLLAGMKLNAKMFDGSDPTGPRTIDRMVGERVRTKLSTLYNQLKKNTDGAALSFISDQVVTNALESAGLNAQAMDTNMAYKSIQQLIIRNGYSLSGDGGGEVVPGTGGKITLKARGLDRWSKQDAENVWLALFEAHLRNGFVSSAAIGRAGTSLNIGGKEVLELLFSDGDINKVASKFSSENAVRARTLLKAGQEVQRNLADENFAFRDMQLITAALNSEASIRIEDQISPAARRDPKINGLGILLDAMEWAFANDPKYSNQQPNLKLDFGAEIINLGTVVDKEGNASRPGVKRLKEALALVKAAGRNDGDVKRLDYDLKLMVVQSLYANHQVPGKININQTLSEIVTNYTSSLMESTDLSDIGTPEAERRSRANSRRMDIIGGLVDQMGNNIRQAGLPTQEGVGRTVAQTLERTGASITPLKEYRARWRQEIARNSGRAAIRRSPDGQARIAYLSGAWSLESLYSVLDSISDGTGNFRADSIEILADFMPPPEVAMGMYSFSGEREYAAGMDLESPFVRRRIEALTKVGEAGKVDPLATIYKYIQDSGPGMETLFKKKVLDTEFAALTGSLELEMSTKGQKAYVHMANDTLREVGFSPRPGPRGASTAQPAVTPEVSMASSQLPNAPTVNKAAHTVSENNASQTTVSESLERAADTPSSIEVRTGWQDALQFNGGTRTIANRIDGYAAQAEASVLNATNQNFVSEVRTLASNLVSNTIAEAELTDTPPRTIVGGLNQVLAQRENAPTINGINFTAQYMRPAGLADDFTHMMESELVEQLIAAMRAGTEEDISIAAEEFKVAFPAYGEAIVAGIGQARRRREGGSSPGFPEGAALAPANSQGSSKAKASLASVAAPARVNEDLVLARTRIEKELDRGQVGVLTNLENRGVVTIVHETTDVPAEVLALLAPAERSSTKLQAVTHNNRVWLIAKNLPRGAAWPVLLHEVGVHVGFEQMLGKEGLAEMANLIMDRANRGDWVAQQAMSRFRAAATVNPRLNDRRDPAGNHEIVAYFVETQAGTPMSESILDKLLSMMRRWAFKFFGASAKVLTNKDIMQLAYSAMRRVPTPTVPPVAAGRPDNFKPRTAPAAAAIKMPSTPETGRLDTGGGAVIDVKPPSGDKQKQGRKYYADRDTAIDNGKDVEQANVDSVPRKRTPLEVRKDISQEFANKTSNKMAGFVARFVDAMSPARRAMDKAARAVDLNDIPAEANFVMQAILGVDKHAITENFLDNEVLPQIRKITDDLKQSLGGLRREDGRRWAEDNILQLVNHRIEALAAKEQNEAYVMFQAPLAPIAHAERAKILEQWKAGKLDGPAVRRSIVQIFKRHRTEVNDMPAWLREHAHAGSGVHMDTINKILNAEKGAFAAGGQQFAQLDTLVSQVQQHTMGLLAEAGHIDATLLPLYGFKYYIPLDGSIVTKEKGGDEITQILTGTRSMVTPVAWDNRSADIVTRAPSEGMRGDAMDRMFMWAMNASQMKAENDTSRAMLRYHDEYNNTAAGDILRVKKAGTAGYIEIKDGVLAKTQLGNDISRPLSENQFVFRGEGKVTLLELENSGEGRNTSLAVKGTWRTSHPGNEVLPDAANNILIGGGRLMASLFTRYNPFFWGRAMLRDSQTYLAILTNEFGAGTATKFSGEMAVMMASRLGVGTVGSMSKDISRIERGQAPQTSMGQDYQILLSHGAVTSRTRLLSQQGRNLALSEAFKGPLATAGKDLSDFLSTISQGAEMIPRIAAFRAFRSSGMDEQTAAFHSKRLMDFSQQGTDIKRNSLMTSWFLFLRPALTGAARILESFEQMTKDNPARAAAITGMWIGMGAFMAALAHYLTDDDDEEEWLGQNPDRQMFGLRFPGKSFGMRRDVEVPFGYGIGWFFGIGALLYRGQVTGDYSDLNFGTLGRGAARHFTPFEWQGTAVKTLTNMAMPDVMAPFNELATNESRWGYSIYKTRDTVPDYLDAKAHTGEIWLDASSALNTLGESLGFGDAWSISPDAMRSFAGLAPAARTITDIISLGKEGLGMDALLEAAGQLTGVAGTRSDYYADGWSDLQRAKEEATQEIARINYLGHGASAKDMSNLSNATRLKTMVNGFDKKLKKLYTARQDLADSFVQSGLPKDRDAIARIDDLIMKQKAAAVNLGLVE